MPPTKKKAPVKRAGKKAVTTASRRKSSKRAKSKPTKRATSKKTAQIPLGDQVDRGARVAKARC